MTMENEIRSLRLLIDMIKNIFPETTDLIDNSLIVIDKFDKLCTCDTDIYCMKEETGCGDMINYCNFCKKIRK